MKKAFTLVELLIVIALIAILSVAVLATINPIEQSNKARDASTKNDAAEVLGAYERYYASANTYPWGNPEEVGATTILSTSPSFGIGKAVSGSPNDGSGVLITTSELKTSFAGKTPFTASLSPSDIMYVYNNGSDGNYVCFVPKAKANRSLYGLLRCLDDGVMLSPGEGGCHAVVATSDSWTQGASYLSATEAHFLCVPEGAVIPNVTPQAAAPVIPTVAP